MYNIIGVVWLCDVGVGDGIFVGCSIVANNLVGSLKLTYACWTRTVTLLCVVQTVFFSAATKQCFGW